MIVRVVYKIDRKYNKMQFLQFWIKKTEWIFLKWNEQKK